MNELSQVLLGPFEKCVEGNCQILLANCMGALGVDRFWSEILHLSRNSKDQKVRELAVKIMR